MGHSASVQPTRLTSSAKPRPSEVVVSSNKRVHSSPTLRKGRRKDPTVRTRPDVCRHDDHNGQVSETEKSQMNGATNTLPSGIKLSPEVIVSINWSHLVCLSFRLSVYFHIRIFDSDGSGGGSSSSSNSNSGQGDHLSGKPGNIREFDSCQGNVREKILSGKSGTLVVTLWTCYGAL